MMRHHRLLTAEEEIELGRRIHAGDQEALDELVQHNMRLVYKIAKRFYSSDPATDFDDLMSEGLEGLLIAAQKYDPSRGTRFSTYATWWIRQKVRRCVLTSGTIRKSGNPNYQHVRPQDARMHALRHAPIARLDAALIGRKGDESSDTLGDLIADDSVSVEDQVLDRVEFERIMGRMRLDQRGQAILRDWLFSDFSREEAAKRHGLSRSWIYSMLVTRKGWLMPRESSSTCLEPGCNKPKYVNDSGKKFARCEEHQKLLWREATKARQQQEARASEIASRPAVTANKPSHLGTFPVAVRKKENVYQDGHVDVDQSVPDCPEDQPAEVCAACVYRQAVEAAAAKYPELPELVQAYRTINQILGK